MDYDDMAFCRDQITAIRSATMWLEQSIFLPESQMPVGKTSMLMVGQIEQALGLIIGRIEGVGDHSQMSLGLVC